MKRRHFLWYTLLFIAGCGTAASNKTNQSDLSSTSQALRLAVTDVQGLEDLKRNYETFRQTWSEVTIATH